MFVTYELGTLTRSGYLKFKTKIVYYGLLDTIRYDTTIVMCVQKLTGNQFSLPRNLH